ncbi:HEAT repeat domain-containing protein [Candidatus Micrarchaeota archaeon]|nr:HEAT repeat domain-containing protein [Candidatus Micrarchaeota archaeon]
MSEEERIGLLLTHLLSDDNELKVEAFEDLVEDIGEPAVPALLDLLKIGDKKAKAHALWVLEGIGGDSALSALLAEAGSRESEVRCEAIEALGKFGNPEALSVLSEAIMDECPETGNAAFKALKKIGVPAIDALVSVIMAASEEKDAPAGRRAAEALSGTEQRPPGPCPLGLLYALRHDSAFVRANAAAAFGGTAWRLSAPWALASAIKDKSPIVRAAAAEAMGTLKGLPPCDIGPLLNALGDPVPLVRQNSACALGNIRNPGATVGLISALQDDDESVVLSCVQALGKIGDWRAVPALAGLLMGPNPLLRDAAAEAMTMRCPHATAVFIRALKGRSEELRAVSANALGEDTDPAAIPALIESLDDQSPKVRAAAAGALGKINAGGNFQRDIAPAIPRLVELLRDKNEGVVAASSCCLATLLPRKAEELYSLHKAVIHLGKSRGWGSGENRGRDSLADTYNRWFAHLQKKSIMEHEKGGMQEPPPRFRNPISRRARNNSAGQMRAAIGGRRA